MSIASLATAQQVPYFNHVYLNPSLINPSLSGMSDNSELMLIQRNNLIGLPESPRTTMLNLQSKLSKNAGLGFTLNRESLGITTKTSAYGSYAYRIQIQDNHSFNLGMSIGMFQFSIDPDMATIENPNDPVLLNKRFKSTTLDGSVGLSYINRNFRIGASAMQAFASKVNLANDVNFKLEQNFVGSVQYTLYVNRQRDLAITPIIIARYSKTTLPQDVILAMSYKEKFWLSPSYNSAGAFGITASAYIHDNLAAGYGYESLTKKPLAGNQRGGHEVMLSYRFNNHSKTFEKQQAEIDKLYQFMKEAKRSQDRRDSLQDALINQVDEVNNQRYDSVSMSVKETQAALDKLRQQLIDAGVIREFSKDEYDNAEVGYYIVIASVKNTRFNAIAMETEYLTRGYKVVYNKVRGWHYVYTVRVEDFADALALLKNTRATIEKTAWIHILK